MSSVAVIMHTVNYVHFKMIYSTIDFRRIIFMPNPGKSFNHTCIGNMPFFKFQSQKGKVHKIIDTFPYQTSDFFFFFHQLNMSILLPMPNPLENHLLV